MIKEEQEKNRIMMHRWKARKMKLGNISKIRRKKKIKEEQENRIMMRRIRLNGKIRHSKKVV
jgi:hypothetical protein